MSPSPDNPWADIGPASPSRIRAKRVSESGPYDFFWARNADGRYAFVLDTQVDVGEWGPPPAIRGISITYYRGQHQLQLVLQDSSDWEVFRDLCLNLFQATVRCQTITDAMEALMKRLLRWQRLLSKGPRRILDEREIRGLIGELLFLQNELLPRFGPRAVDWWQGPDRLPQDFVLGTHLVEVKTHLVGDAPRIYISSPEQLWSDINPIFLVVTPLSRGGGTDAASLPDLVQAISAVLAGTTYLEQFEQRLDDFRYLPLPEYEEQRYLPGASSVFEVREGFPRLVSRDIPEGVRDVRYSITLDACSRFASQLDWQLFERNLA